MTLNTFENHVGLQNALGRAQEREKNVTESDIQKAPQYEIPNKKANSQNVGRRPIGPPLSPWNPSLF